MALPSSCRGCSLSTNPYAGKFTKPRGLGQKGVLIIGDASSDKDSYSGIALDPYSQAGLVLNKALQRQSIDADNDVWITNLIHCQPPSKDLNPHIPQHSSAIAHCRPNLTSLIAQLKPKVIVALGSTVLRALTGFGEGKKTSDRYLRGYVLSSTYGIPLIPTMHPAMIARGNTALQSYLMRDLARAIEVAETGELPVVEPGQVVDYRQTISDGWELFLKAQHDPSLTISFDIETDWSAEEDEDELLSLASEQGDEDDSEEESDPNSLSLSTTGAQIRSIQFSIAPGTGVTLNWLEAKILTQQIFDLPNPKVGHNCWNFDLPILRRHGITTKGIIHDTMWMWHHYQPDLPAHLQGVACQFGMPFPWKHYSDSAPEFYGAADVDATIRIALHLPNLLRELNLWTGYDIYVREFRTVLDRMEARGIPVDKAKLQDFRAELEIEAANILSEIQNFIPDEVLNIKSTASPKAVKDWAKAKLTDRFLDLPKTRRPKVGDMVKMVADDLDLLGECQAETGYIWSPRDNFWFKREPFNPKSSMQMQAYIRHRRYKMPTRFKDGKPTTSSKELLRLGAKTNDPVFRLTDDLRATTKMGDAYAGKLLPSGKAEGGWVPDSDGRLRATFTFGPATGQLAAKSPNVLTTPKRRPNLAKRFGTCIAAPDGYKLIQFDYKSFHARTTALEAKDKILDRLATLDIHSFVAGHLVHYKGIDTCLSMSDKDLKAFLKEVRAAHPKVRDYQAKPAVHGTNFGQGYRRLYFEYADHFASEAEAKRLLDLLKDLFPRLFAWQQEVCERASTNGFLLSRWGAIRWFWEAMKWQKDTATNKWIRVLGRDAEKCKAFLPANDAHLMLRQKELELYHLDWDNKFGLINSIHDAVLFCCPDSLVEECVSEVRALLEAPVIELSCPDMAPDGFSCGVDASVGPDWAHMDEV